MDNTVYIPPIKIQGIKTKLVPLIREHIVLEPDSVWYEPFLGSGVVGFNVAPHHAVFSDINPHVINFYNQIKDGEITPKRVRAFLMQEGKSLERDDDDYYYIVRDRFNRSHDPLDFLFLNRACFNGMIRFNKNYEFNVPYGHKPYRFSKAYVTKIVNQVAHVEYLIKKNHWTFLCQPFQKTIAMASKGDFIYCDPPYIGRHVDYFDSWDVASEKQLHEALTKVQSNFMLSTWHHNDYRINDSIKELWPECFVITQNHFYHVGAKEKNRHPMVEALLTNYKTTGKINRAAVETGQMQITSWNTCL